MAATCVAAGLIAIWSGSAAGQADVTRQEDIKATFVYNFAKFVEWPDSSFGQTVTAFRIEIIGRDPFEGRLDQLMIGKTMHDRPIEVVHSFGDPSRGMVHIACVGASEQGRVAALLAAYRDRHVLTVSDLADFTQLGGMIGFLTERAAVRFRINQAAAEQSQLRVSSRLLALGVPLPVAAR